jgi:hypothetical protein
VGSPIRPEWLPLYLYYEGEKPPANLNRTKNPEASKERNKTGKFPANFLVYNNKK